MQKFMLWVITAILTCSSTMFTSCSKDDNPVDPSQNLAEKIIGMWLLEGADGEIFPTNSKAVLTISATKANMSGSLIDTGEPTAWDEGTDFDLSIEGNHLTLTSVIDEHKTLVFELVVTSINEQRMQANWKITRIFNGQEEASPWGVICFSKIRRDYSETILGTWKNEEARWTFKTDGTFAYYRLNDAGEWVPSEDDFAEYYVVGNLLCCRWKNTGEGQEEKRESWEIKSIKNGVMKWTALRRQEDGSTYTETIKTTKEE